MGNMIKTLWMFFSIILKLLGTEVYRFMANCFRENRIPEVPYPAN